jgi:hypothetical protein
VELGRLAGQDTAMPTIPAALRHDENANGSKPAGCAPPSCSPSGSAKPRSPASSASPPGREHLACPLARRRT